MIGQDQQEERTAELILVLQELEEPSLSESDLRSLGNRLKLIYISENGDLYRHSYSEITNYMYSSHVIDNVPTPDPGSVILDHLRSIADGWETEEASEATELLCSAIRKLIDHISLEVVRLGQMADIYYKLTETDQLNQQLGTVVQGIREVGETLRQQKEEAERVGEELKLRKKEVDEIQLDVKNHNTQAITVLSIFSCVVFAFTGGFSLITGSLNVLGSITRAKSLLLVGILLLLSLVLVDTIYMLLRAARHYSSDKQGHLRSFVAVNIVVGLMAAVIMLMYFVPCWFPFLYR